MTNEKNLTPEMLEKAKSATSATELLTIAQENGIALTTEQAANYYAQLHPEVGALSDEELDNVSGGGLCSDPPEKCRFCGDTIFYRWPDYNDNWRWICKNCKNFD